MLLDNKKNGKLQPYIEMWSQKIGQVALKALRGEKTLSELSSQYGVHAALALRTNNAGFWVYRA